MATVSTRTGDVASSARVVQSGVPRAAAMLRSWPRSPWMACSRRHEAACRPCRSRRPLLVPRLSVDKDVRTRAFAGHRSHPPSAAAARGEARSLLAGRSGVRQGVYDGPGDNAPEFRHSRARRRSSSRSPDNLRALAHSRPAFSQLGTAFDRSTPRRCRASRCGSSRAAPRLLPPRMTDTDLSRIAHRSFAR